MTNGTLVIGLTGGIGTGKSRVADLLRELGAVVECSDRIVRELQAPGRPVLQEIADAFGHDVLTAEGELDRARLGERVFGDPAARQRLNRIVHPRVYQEFGERLKRHVQQRVPIVVFDIPLLLEGRQQGRGSGAGLPFDQIAVVYASEDTQIERVQTRDTLSKEAAEQRVRAQMPIEEKRALADVVIENSGPWSDTESQVRRIYASWLERIEQTSRASD